MEAITLLYAHPYPGRSIACRALVEAAATLEGVEVRPLYSLYPDFDVDVTAERAALERAGLVVCLHPLYWYAMPGLLKHYFDVVFAKGWAYGTGSVLAGKSCLWAATTGGDAKAFSAEGRHHHPLRDFAPPIEETMRYCGLRWLDPYVVLGAHDLAPEALAAAATGFRDRLAGWREAPR